MVLLPVVRRYYDALFDRAIARQWHDREAAVARAAGAVAAAAQLWPVAVVAV